jgi:hypothetical protein
MCLFILSSFSTDKKCSINVIHRQGWGKYKYRSNRKEILSHPIQKHISVLKILPKLITRNFKTWQKMSLVVIFLKTVVFTVLRNMFELLTINCHVMNKTWVVVIFTIIEATEEEKEMCHPRGRQCPLGRTARPTTKYINRKIIF